MPSDSRRLLSLMLCQKIGGAPRPPSSVRTKCDRCGVPVWIDERADELLERGFDYAAACEDCWQLAGDHDGGPSQ
jgi:hypothetical protein